MFDELIVQLRRDEGCVLHAYEDTMGLLTIGVGRLIDKRRGGGISMVEAAYLLTNDLNKVDRELQERLPWVVTLSHARRGVIQAMAFQLGVNGLLGFENTLKMIEQGEYDKAARAMLQSRWATQTPERAHRLSEQMRTNTWK